MNVEFIKRVKFLNKKFNPQDVSIKINHSRTSVHLMLGLHRKTHTFIGPGIILFAD